MGRISIAGLLGLVGLFAVGLAALTSATAAWLGFFFLLTFGLLFAGVVGWILRGRRSGGWVGFVVFGWGFFLLEYRPGVNSFDRLASDAVADWAFEMVNPTPVDPPGWPPTTTLTPPEQAYYNAASSHHERAVNAEIIGHWLFLLLAGQIGSILGVVVARGRGPGVEAPPPTTIPSPPR